LQAKPALQQSVESGDIFSLLDILEFDDEADKTESRCFIGV